MHERGMMVKGNPYTTAVHPQSGEQPVQTGADHRSLWKGSFFQKDEIDTILHVFKHTKSFTQGEFGN